MAGFESLDAELPGPVDELPKLDFSTFVLSIVTLYGRR